jgi:capsular polysaccharide biosynthesis protein
MVLRHYWRIFWKRAWIPALLVVIVLVVSLLTTTTPPPSYNITMRFTVGVKPQELTDQYTYDSYYAWLSSEYLADDLSAIVSSQEFANDVNRHLAEMGSVVQIPPGSIAGVTVAEKQHRLLRLNLTWGNTAELADISAATVSALQQDSPKYLAQLGTPGALISLIDAPSAPAANPPSLTQRLNLPVRLLLALAAGLALVFLLEYLDDSVRDRAELEAMDIGVLAEVPWQKR